MEQVLGDVGWERADLRWHRDLTLETTSQRVYQPRDGLHVVVRLFSDQSPEDMFSIVFIGEPSDI